MIPLVLCSTYEGQPPEHYVIEPKIDGVRICIEANYKMKEVAFYSRGGQEITSLNWLKESVLDLIKGTSGEIYLDGEAVSGTCQQTIASLFQERFEARAATIYLFDVIQDEQWHVRRDWMRKNLRFNDDIKLVQESARNVDIKETYKEYRRLGFEGAVIKDVFSLYDGGERSPDWQKMKEKETFDLQIVGIKEGKVFETLGAFEVEFQKKIYPVGAGITAEQRRRFWKIRERLVGKTIEVACQELTASGAMRHPTFVRIRADK